MPCWFQCVIDALCFVAHGSSVSSPAYCPNWSGGKRQGWRAHHGRHHTSGPESAWCAASAQEKLFLPGTTIDVDSHALASPKASPQGPRRCPSRPIDGRRCDCHGTRRAGGVNAALSEREKNGALRAPSLHINSRRCLSLYTLDCVPPSGSFSLRVVAWWSSVATVARAAPGRLRS